MVSSAGSSLGAGASEPQAEQAAARPTARTWEHPRQCAPLTAALMHRQRHGTLEGATCIARPPSARHQ
eukprot:13481477-Alexandrium_andersonii.AAC.1